MAKNLNSPFEDLNALAERITEAVKINQSDRDIALSLGLDEPTVRYFRLGIGLRRFRAGGDLTTDYRKVCRYTTNSAHSLNSFSMRSISEKLGLEEGKNYEWIVTKVGKMKFEITLREREAE